MLFVFQIHRNSFLKEACMKTSVKRSGFSMIELVFVIVILGVLAAVAVPRFVATRTDAQVATARSDLSSAQKAIVAKVFADNIDATQANAPDPNKAVRDQTNMTLSWGEWMVEVAGLDKGRWTPGDKVANVAKITGKNATNEIAKDKTGNVASSIPKDSLAALGNVNDGSRTGYGSCGAVLGIGQGWLIFAPNNLSETAGAFCKSLRESYKAGTDLGNKTIPLTSTGTIEF